MDAHAGPAAAATARSRPRRWPRAPPDFLVVPDELAADVPTGPGPRTRRGRSARDELHHAGYVMKLG